jgi:hypothetical protein
LRFFFRVTLRRHDIVEHTFHSRGAQAAGGAEPRRSGAAARCGTRAQVQTGTERSLRCRRRSQQADLSMLRRSHARHRGLRARVNASASADSSNDCRQARHLMTASQSRKSGHRSRRLSIGHGRARSNIQLASQIVRQFIMPDAISRPFTSRFTVGQLAGAARARSQISPAALESP